MRPCHPPAWCLVSLSRAKSRGYSSDRSEQIHYHCRWNYDRCFRSGGFVVRRRAFSNRYRIHWSLIPFLTPLLSHSNTQRPFRRFPSVHMWREKRDRPFHFPILLTTANPGRACRNCYLPAGQLSSSDTSGGVNALDSVSRATSDVAQVFPSITRLVYHWNGKGSHWRSRQADVHDVCTSLHHLLSDHPHTCVPRTYR